MRVQVQDPRWSVENFEKSCHSHERGATERTLYFGGLRLAHYIERKSLSGSGKNGSHSPMEPIVMEI